jgi:hypothetical protein
MNTQTMTIMMTTTRAVYNDWERFLKKIENCNIQSVRINYKIFESQHKNVVLTAYKNKLEKIIKQKEIEINENLPF